MLAAAPPGADGDDSGRLVGIDKVADDPVATHHYIADGTAMGMRISTTRIALAATKTGKADTSWQADYGLSPLRSLADSRFDVYATASPLDSTTLQDLYAQGVIDGEAPVFEVLSTRSEAVLLDEAIVELADGVAADDFFATRPVFIGYRPLMGTPNQFVATLSTDVGTAALAAINALGSDTDVAWAAPNFHQNWQRSFVPNDPRWANLWHLQNTGQGGGTAGIDADLPAAWDVVRGGSTAITIGVVDDGVSGVHPDLNVWTNPGEVPGNGIDDDRNGWIDDVNGWNFVSNNNRTWPEYSLDGHGTSVAGVAAARGNNGLGVTGASYGTPVLSAKIFLMNNGLFHQVATDANIAAAVYYAAGRTANGRGTWKAADLTNHSWGGGAPSTAITNAFTWATSQGRQGKGAVQLVATGNDSGVVSSPALLSLTNSGVIAVGAINNKGERSAYSNYGAALDIVAPSDDSRNGYLAIDTTDMIGRYGYNKSEGAAGDYTGTGATGFGGTSSATPLATGIAALALARARALDVDLTPAQIKGLFQTNTRLVGSGDYDPATGRNVELGYGMISAAGVVRGVGTRKVSVFGGKTEITSGVSVVPVTGYLDESVDTVFRIRNQGTLPLTLRGITLLPTNLGDTVRDFAIIRQPAATVLAVGEATTFTVRFTPTRVGVTSADISVGCDDTTSNIFSFTVAGTGVAATISGYAFEDADGDGIRQADEPALAGRRIYVDSNGNGQFDASSEDVTVSAVLTKNVIPDLGTVQNHLRVSGLTAPISDVDVAVSIRHPRVSALRLRLFAPSGRQIHLVNRAGLGGNFTATVFDDESPTALADGTSPFTGSFRPSEPLSVLNGESGNGSWTLEVADEAFVDTGTIEAWSIRIRTGAGEVSAVSKPNGFYAIPGLAAGSHVLKAVMPAAWTGTGPASRAFTVTGPADTFRGVNVGSGFNNRFYGRVFDDANANGVKDPAEAGVAGRTLFLDPDGNGVMDPPVRTTFRNVAYVAIPDKPTSGFVPLTSSIVVSGLGHSIADVNVRLNITHSFDTDLDVALIAPDGTRVGLFNDVGAAYYHTGKSGFFDTVLDDEARFMITDGVAPFKDAYRPIESLAVLNGRKPNGTWRLEITDDHVGDVGMLNFWEVIISTVESRTTDTAGNAWFDLADASTAIRSAGDIEWAATEPSTGVRSVSVGGAPLFAQSYGVKRRPAVASDSSSVTVAEGTAATITGTWGTAYPGDAITLAASMGAVTRNANGTWSWYAPPAAQAGTTAVTIIATDPQGITATTSFDVTVTEAPTPRAPTGVTGTPGDERIILWWNAPVSNGGAPITDYVIEYRIASESTWITFADGTGTATWANVTGLVNRTAYVFRVAAVNAAGIGKYSNVSPVVAPAMPPAAPGDVTGFAEDTQVRLSWTAPTSNGGAVIENYVIQYSSNGGSTWTDFDDGPDADPAARVTGLTNGVAYVFRVAAVNAIGTGPYSTVSAPVTPTTAPGAPTGVTGSSGEGRVSISWFAPLSHGGSALRDYIVQYKTLAAPTWTTFPDSVSLTTSATVTGLTNGTSYVFRVLAVNASGAGAPSISSPAYTPLGPPAAPTGVTGNAERGQMRVSWMAPAADGGRPVTGYRIEMSNDGFNWTRAAEAAAADTSVTIPGLMDGLTYRVRVAAENARGAGSPSDVAAVTVPREPGFPVRGGGPAGAGTRAVATVAGATIVTGWFSGSATFGTTTLTSSGESDVFVAKLGADGSYVWAVRAGGTGADEGVGIAALANGTMFVVGTASTAATFSGAVLADSGSFVALLDQHGTFVWVRSVGGSVADVATFGDGSAVVTGDFWGSATFGSTTLVSSGSRDAFVAKIGGGGTYQWVRRAGAYVEPAPPGWDPSDPMSPGWGWYTPMPPMGDVRGPSVATATDGSVYVAGTFDGLVEFFGGQVLGGGYAASRLFVAKLNPGGSLAWARDPNSEAGDGSTPGWVTDVTDVAATAGGVLVCGEFNGEMSFGSTKLDGFGNSFFAALQADDGDADWATQATGRVAGMVASSDGNAIVTGSFSSSGVFGGTGKSTYEPSSLRISGSFGDSFVGALSGGYFGWVAGLNGGLSDWGSGAVVGLGLLPDGSVALAGDLFQGSAVFGEVGVTSTGGSTVWVTRVLADGSLNLLPGEPTDVVGIPGVGQVRLSWSTPVRRGATPITDYRVEYSSDDGATWTTFFDGVSAATSATVTGLASGTSYLFRVSAASSTGVGRPSANSAALTPHLVRPTGWPKQVGGAESVDSIAVFGDGSAVVAGTALAGAAFGGTLMPTGGPFVARLDADGAFAWVKRAGGGGVAAAADGSTIVAGTTSVIWPAAVTSFASSGSSVMFDPMSSWQGSWSAQHMLLTRLNADGSVAWRTTAGATPGDYVMSTDPRGNDAVVPTAVAQCADGSTLVAGWFQGRANFGGATLISPASEGPQLFVAKFGRNGTFTWVITPGLASDTGGYDLFSGAPERFDIELSPFPDGSVALMGRFGSSITFGDTTLTASAAPVGDANCFVVKLAPTGAVTWAKQVGTVDTSQMSSSSFSRLHDIAAAADGSLFVVGDFVGDVLFGDVLYRSSNPWSYDRPDAFVAKLASNGSLAWVTVGAGVDADAQSRFSATGIATLADGTAIVTGSFTHAGAFGGIALKGSGSGRSDAFVARVRAEGSVAWAVWAGGADDDEGVDVAALSGGTAVITGLFQGSVSFGGSELDAAGDIDLFVTTIGTHGVFQVPEDGITVPAGQTLADTTTRIGDYRLSKRGLGTLILDRANSHSGGTVVEAGEVIVRNLAALGTGTLDVRAGAKVTFDVGSVNWNGGANFVQLSRLELDPAGRLEVGTGQIRMPAGTYDLTAIRAALSSGRNGGAWNGAAGFTSASAGLGTSRAIGYRVMPSTGELRLGFAALGDATLDGQLSFTDISLINNGGKFGQGKASSPGWAEGDFNYSGDVTFTDISLLNNSGVYGKGGYLPAAPASRSSSQTTSSDAGTISTDLWAAYALATESKTTTKKR